MTSTQRDKLLSVTDKLRLMSYAVSQEMDEDQSVQIAYDLAAQLQDIEAELLTIPHIKAA